jgi:thioredoxin reductase (NADPH)
MLVRSQGLAASMSGYLIGCIEASERIALHTETEIVELIGGRHLQEVRWANRRIGNETTRGIANVFLMLGAVRNSEWLRDCVAVGKDPSWSRPSTRS